MSKGKRNRETPKRKSVEALEFGLQKLAILQLRSEARTAKLKAKIASAEEKIAAAKVEEAK